MRIGPKIQRAAQVLIMAFKTIAGGHMLMAAPLPFDDERVIVASALAPAAV